MADQLSKKQEYQKAKLLTKTMRETMGRGVIPDFTRREAFINSLPKIHNHGQQWINSAFGGNMTAAMSFHDFYLTGFQWVGVNKPPRVLIKPPKDKLYLGCSLSSTSLARALLLCDLMVMERILSAMTDIEIKKEEAAKGKTDA